MLNNKVLGGSADELVLTAAPRAPGELRKHYHKAPSANWRVRLRRI
jgi:protein required for attachment to host cells